MIKKILSDEMVKGGIVLFIMISIFNFLNYLFHFITARMLDPSQYGVLVTLMSIIYIITIPSEAIQTIVTKYTSNFYKYKQYGKIRTLFNKFFNKGLKISLFVFLIYILFTPIISNLLKIEISLLVISGFAIFIVFIMPVGRGILQGTKKFYLLGINYLSEGIIKLFLTVILISLGLSIFGAISSVIIAALAAFFISIFSYIDIYKYKKERLKIDGLYSYSLNVFLLFASIIVILSTDIIIARMIFPPDVVGKYAVASTIGKMIFFSTLPISKVMFPLTSEKTGDKGNTIILFVKSLVLILIISFTALLIFWLFPQQFISILFSDKYIDVSGIIIYTGISFTILSISNLLLTYYLSQNEKISVIRVIFFMMIIFIIQFSLLFHTDSIKEFALFLLFSNIIIFIIALFFINK